MAVVLIGTLDTKGRELGLVRDILRGRGIETLVVDAGSQGPPTTRPEISREEVFRRAGISVGSLRDRGEAVSKAAEGVAAVVAELHREGRVEGVFGLGGSAGTVIGTSAMRALPFGVPKVMVSTLASGQTRPYVGGSDIAMFYPVADLAGLNRLTRTALSNAAHALAGMVLAPKVVEPPGASKPAVAATMFGVTTPCVDRARQGLEAQGCEVLVFHATGIGGQSMEGLIRDGEVDAVLDLTTTELADELVGGTLSAGPDRLEAAVCRGIPQVISVGALDMVNFGPMDSVPERFRGRKFHRHNASVTLMRTTPEENDRIGRRIGEVLARASVPTVVLLPMGGVSAIDAPGQPFHDPEADSALFRAIHESLDDHPLVTVVDRAHHINDPEFADQAAFLLRVLMTPDPQPEAPRR
ncbi:Tm-1-like ATP-binding domain-containing protein [Tundrisphaera lichenicola]|uniref:Tm-1-like ATP-binding domain-containing protein n=1 Tax=Tundrisphaera lichenicola TaxID=2029860 RepID=UPI003EBA2B50